MREVRWAAGAGGVSVPGVAVNLVENESGGRDGVAAILSGDARPSAGAHALKEMLQLGRQLIDGPAIQLQHLKVAAEKVLAQAIAAGRV